MMLEEAQRYLGLGFSVIPIRREDKKPAIGSWREYQTKRADAAQLEAWFDSDTWHNIGIVAGAISNLAIVDFDGYSGEDPAGFLKRYGLPSYAPIAITGKGFHVYYRHPGGIVRNGVRIGTLGSVAVDLRGDGGYVVAPPSVHENGKQYHWLNPEMLLDPVWDILPDAFTRTAEDRKAIAKPSDFGRESEIALLMRGVGSGGRNHAAAKLAGFWLKVTHGDEQATLMALRAWNSQNQPSLDERELLTTFQSIVRAYQPEESQAPPEASVMDGKTWAAAVRDIPPRRGIPNPAIPTMNELGGIVERDLVILAGRPGMGKSTAAWGTVVDAGITGKLPTVIFSTEMTANDVARWVASRMYQTPVRDLTPDQWDKALRQIAASPLTMCDQGALTVEGIIAVVKARPGTKLVIVDHIQRINGGRGDSRNQQLGAIAKALKSLAKDELCTVLALSQLNRAGEPGERPRLENLRESGDLEQEADAVIFLWSPHDDPTANPLPVEFYLAKNRHGALAQVDAMFYKHLKRFDPMDGASKLAAMLQADAHREKLQELMREGS